MKRLVSLFATILALVAVACGGDDVDKPAKKPSTNVQDPNAPFYVDFEAITRGSVTFGVTPKNFEIDYLCMVYDKETVEDFTRDQFIVEQVLNDLEVEAAKAYRTLDEHFPFVRQRSVSEGLKFGRLTLNADHYVVVFGVEKSADGYKGYKATTKVVKVPFKTLDVEMSDATFTVEPYISYNNVALDVYPTDKEQLWYICTMPKAEYNYYVGTGNNQVDMGTYYKALFANDVNTLGAGVIHSGDVRVGAAGLQANTDYSYLVAGCIIDSDGIVVVTDIVYGEYTTDEAEPSDMYFDIEIRGVDQMSVAYSITPHNAKEGDTYCALVQPWDGTSTAEQVMNRIVNLWTSKGDGFMETMLVTGKVDSISKPMPLPQAGAKYYIIAFGYNGGITTKAYWKTFETLPGGKAEDAQFTATASSIASYGFTLNVKTTDPTVHYAPAAFLSGEFKEEKEIPAIEEHINDLLTGSQEFNPYYTMAEVLDQYYYNGDWTFNLSGMEPMKEYMVCIYVFDDETGEVVNVFTFDKIACTTAVGKIVPEIELVGVFSGEDEAGTIFDEPELTAGKAILVFKFSGIEEASKLQVSLADLNMSNKVEYTDIQVWSIMTGKWTECDLNKPYMFYAPTEWNQDYTALAYAEDENGANGNIARLWVKPTLKDKSDIKDLRELFDELYPKEGTETTRGTLPASLVVPVEL